MKPAIEPFRIRDNLAFESLRSIPMANRFIADFEQDLGMLPDNLEGLAFGPQLADGRMLLIAVSDNNFNPSQTTQFIAMAVTLK